MNGSFGSQVIVSKIYELLLFILLENIQSGISMNIIKYL